tara:strand:+ start:117 stop:1175 length:1059 start_codon:yes stop_codon:yes gene_type:complete
MGTTDVTIDNDVLSMIGINAAEEARDLKTIVTPLLSEMERVHGKGQPFKSVGGKWNGSFQTKDHSQGTARRTGFEQLNLTVQSTRSTMLLNAAEVSYPILVSATEQDETGGADGTYELGADRAASTMGFAKRSLEKHLLIGGMAGFDDFLTLNGVDYSDGLLEGSGPGTQSNNIGGFSKATWSSLPGANNQVFDIGGSFNSAGLAGLYRVINRTKNRATDELSGLCAILSENMFENYKRSVQAQERYVMVDNKDTVDALNMGLMINGMKAMPSTYLGSSPVGGANVISGMVIDLKAIYFCWSKIVRDGFLNMSEFKDIGNGYNIKGAELLIRGQLWPKSWGSSGILLNGEQF